MIAVVGGGFNGIYAAWRLARDGEDVALFEASKRLGGGMQSLDFRGFSVDFGAQVLDFRQAGHEDFFRDLMGDDVRVLDQFSGGSSATGSITRNLEYPDFGSEREFSAAALFQLHEKLLEPVEGQNGTPRSFPEFIRERFGGLVGDRLVAISEKLAGGSVERLGLDAALSFPMLSRVKLGDDAEMIPLKLSDPRLDDRLAVTSACKVPQFLGRNTNPRFGYPSHGGLSSLWTAAHRRLVELGVRIELDSGIARILADAGEATLELADGRTETFSGLAWTLPDKALAFAMGMQNLLDSVPTPTEVDIDLYIFEVLAADIIGPDYLNDFNLSHIVSRCSSGGICSNQIRSDGTTFVTAEVNRRGGLTPREVTGTAKEVWENLVAVGYLRRSAKVLHSAVRTFPRAFVVWPVGQHQDALKASLDDVIGPKVVSCRSEVRGRVAFMERFDNIYSPQLRAS
jgi:protoporphyrinogen oxidase